MKNKQSQIKKHFKLGTVPTWVYKKTKNESAKSIHPSLRTESKKMPVGFLTLKLSPDYIASLSPKYLIPKIYCCAVHIFNGGNLKITVDTIRSTNINLFQKKLRTTCHEI